MRTMNFLVRIPVLAALLAGSWLANAATAAELVWHSTLREGLEEAQRASRPVFLVTMWKDRV